MSDKINNDEINREFERLKNTKVDDEKIKSTLEKEKYVMDVSSKGPLQEFKEIIYIFFDILKHPKKYNISKSTIAIIVGVLLYIVLPIDIVPDVIPIIGFMDDAAIVGAAVGALGKEINNLTEIYKKDKDK